MNETSSNPKVRKAPVCIRLSERERARLQKAAGELSLSAYIRARLFDDTESADILPHETRQILLAQILGSLGDAGLARSLAALADAAQAGLLPPTPDTQAKLQDACGQVEEMRDALLHALGLRPGDAP